MVTAQNKAVTVTFLKGEYYGTISLDSLKCPKLDLTAPDGDVLTGGRKTNGTFNLISSCILESTIEKEHRFDRPKIGGKMKILARYPKFCENECLNGSASPSEIEKITASMP